MLIGIGNDVVKADTMDKTPAILTDANGGKLIVLLPLLVAPEMRCHVYSVVDCGQSTVASNPAGARSF